MRLERYNVEMIREKVRQRQGIRETSAIEGVEE